MSKISALKELTKECKYPLKITFTIDCQLNLYIFTVGYQNTLPIIAKHTEIPPDLEAAISDLIIQYDVLASNKKLDLQALKEGNNIRLKPVNNQQSNKSNIQKVKFSSGLI
jgi:hypothetical protein